MWNFLLSLLGVDNRSRIALKGNFLSDDYLVHKFTIGWFQMALILPPEIIESRRLSNDRWLFNYGHLPFWSLVILDLPYVETTVIRSLFARIRIREYIFLALKNPQTISLIDLSM